MNLTGIEGKQIVSGKDTKSQRKVRQKIKLMGIYISGYNVITVKNGGSYTRLPIFLPLKNKWFRRLNINSNHNSCDVPQKEEDYEK